MCLAVPLKVVAIEGAYAQVELGGVLRQVSLIMTPEAREGDYVLVHTGFAIAVLSATEAQETLALLAELERAGQELDAECRDKEGEVASGSPA